MNIDYKKMFVALVVAVMLAVPTAAAFQNHKQAIKSEQRNSSRLKIDVQKKESELNKLKVETEKAIKSKAEEAEKLKQENERLQKELQSKRERQAEEARVAAVQAASGVYGNCESYRPIVQKYFGAATSGAMIVMSKESGCNPNAVSSTNDHGLFQLNGIKVYDPEENIKIAYHQKFVRARRGANNFSAWYAVCTPNLVAKYAGVWCS